MWRIESEARVASTSERSVSLQRRLWNILGPGLVTGAADDDPSGIATYSQAGAQFGYTLAWTMFLTLPFMAAIQIISACIGWATREGLATNIGKRLPRPAVYFIVALLVAANTINIAADLAAMGEALVLAIGGRAFVYAFAFGFVCVMAEVFIPYHRYARYLKISTFVLFAYVATAFTVRLPWSEVLAATFIPHLSFERDMLLTLVAVFGTTISPYLFFWQASQEVEESRLSHRHRYRGKTARRSHFSQISIDTWTGMVFSNLIAFFIIITTAATLHTHGITQIQTAAQAAEALRPVAGELTFLLFSAGIIGTGLLAVPVLAGSAAYAVAETFGFRGSLELPVSRALGFYTLIGTATLVGAVLTVTRIDPIAMLFWTAVINGIVSVPIIVAMMLVVANGRRLGALAIPRWLRTLGWATAVFMGLAVAALVGSSLGS
jgi:NRAMP (natural resistance-associated macrophage protein)-like metal ion transporter